MREEHAHKCHKITHAHDQTREPRIVRWQPLPLCHFKIEMSKYIIGIKVSI